MGTMTITITRHKNHWDTTTTVQYPGFEHPAVTNSSARTLSSALRSTISDITVTAITVNGKPITNQEAYAIIAKGIAGTIVAYELPKYARALGA